MTDLTPFGSAEDWRTLLLEQHHRAETEFASAIDFVAVAALRSESAEVKATLTELAMRLQNYAVLQRTLATPERYDVLIDSAEYLERLGLSMSRSRLDDMQIHLVVAAESLPLRSDRCQRLGLMVHEFITNAARHACFDGKAGEIRVEVQRAGPSAKCIVTDNGSAVPGFKPGRGLKIVNELVKGMAGRLQHSFDDGGARCVLVFPLTERELVAAEATAARRAKTARRLKLIRSAPGVQRRRSKPMDIRPEVQT